MIRPLTCLCVISAAASGLYLYQTKHTTHMLDRQIEQTMQAANAVREHSQMLRAEWANLNDTSRLADLAGRHLNLRQVMPAQFVNFAELDHRLPAIQSFNQPDKAPADPAPAPVQVPVAQGAPAPAPVPVAQAAPAPRPAPPAAAPQVRVAAAPTPLQPLAPRPQIYRTAAGEPGEAAPHAIPHEAAPHEAASHEAAPREAAPREAAPREAVLTMPVMKPVFTQAMATSLPRPAARVAYEPARARLADAAPPVASALGNARTSLAPPVPVPVGDPNALRPR